MSTPRKILVPLALRPRERPVLAEALRLGSALEAAIDVLHVLEPKGARPERLLFTLGYDPAHAEQEQLSASALEALLALCGRSSDAVALHFETGDMTACILQFAARLAPELIVIGTCPHSGLARMRRRTAERIIRRVTCPVLVVPFEPEMAAMPELEPVDILPIGDGV